MPFLHIFFLVIFAFMLGTGQIFLKQAVSVAQVQADTPSIVSMFIALAFTWQFWVAIILCGSMVLVWSWLLSIIPLSKAYPFVVLAFIFAAFLEQYFFGQSLSIKFFIGCALIIAGLTFIVQQ